MKKTKFFLRLFGAIIFITIVFILVISFFCTEDVSSVMCQCGSCGGYACGPDGCKAGSGLKTNILVPPVLMTEDVKVKMTVNYDYPNSDERDKIVYECKSKSSARQFIETIIPQLEPGIVRLQCSIFLYEGEGVPGCDDDMTDWRLYCSAFKSDVTVLLNQLVKVLMSFICSDNAEDFGDVEVQVEGVYIVKKVVGSTYKLPIGVTQITSGEILANVELQLFDDDSLLSNQIIIDDLSGSNVQYSPMTGTSVTSDIEGKFLFNAYIPQSIFVGTSTPTLWILADYQGSTDWTPVEIYQFRNECTIIMENIEN